MAGNQKLQGGIGRVFARYVTLNILSMIGLSVYILADTFFVANGVGTNGLVALNLVLPAWSFMSGIGMLIGVGGSTVYALLRGEKRTEDANRIFTVTMVTAVAVGVIVLIIDLCFTKQIALLLGAGGEQLPLALDYLRMAIGFSPLFMVNQTMVCFVRNDDAPNLAMAAMLAGSISNIFLDYLFVYPMGLGMFGAALATGISPVFSLAIILIFHILRRKNHFHLVRTKPHRHDFKRLFMSGVSSFITEFSSGMIILVFNFTIMSLAGSDGVAAYGIIANVALVCVALLSGIGQGIQPLVSQNYGAGNYSAVKKVLYLACAVAVVFGVLFLLMGNLFPVQISSLFVSGEDAALLDIAAGGMRLYFTAFLFMGINVVLTAFFAAMGDGRPSFVISTCRGFVLVVAFVFLLSSLFGMTGVWLTVPVAELFTSAIAILFVRQFLNRIKS